jgi:nuclear pore complex protein Nup98-Nup96
MTVDELKRVRNFSVSNSFGKIEFGGETDVTGLNLDEIVKIEDKAVTVYPDETTPKPPVGQGLNKPAVVHLYNCQPKKDMPLDVYEDKIRKMCERRGSEFVSWSRRNFEWVFKVPHF